MGQQLYLKTSQIEENEVALRDVQVEDEDFKNLKASIADRGYILPLAVRSEPHEIPGNPPRYILVDGLQRFTAACQIYAEGGTIPSCALGEVPVNVLDIGEADVLETQIEANLTRVETRPIAFSRQLTRIMLRHPTRTLADQAKRLHRSEGWLKQRLNLLTLEGEAAKLVDEGKIGLSNATALARMAKVAPGEVQNWVERAQNQAPDEFFADITQAAKNLKAQQTGERTVSGPPEKMRKTTDIKAEFARAKAVSGKDPSDRYAAGFLAAFEWVLQQDPVSVEAYNKAEAEAARLKAEKKAAKQAQAEAVAA